MPNRTKAELIAENLELRSRLAQTTDSSEPDVDTPGPVSPRRRDSAAIEEALKASEVRYRRLFETAKDGILILDATTGLITDSNPFLEQMLGYSHHELVGRKLWEIGPFKDVAASQESFRQLQSEEYIRYEDLPLETKSGQFRQVEFISNLYLADSVRVIQCNVRDITARRTAEAEIQRANEALSVLVTVLQKRDVELTLLSRMNDLLQTSETKAEAYRMIALTGAELFAGRCGCLAVLPEAGQDLHVVARWGDERLVEDSFASTDCWAMRRGRPHEVVDPRNGLSCHHFVRPPERGYACLPLTVHGESLGVLYVAIGGETGEEDRSREVQLAISAGEVIKLSLANLRLRRKLREQATHDLLTGLFNRRYLEATLPRELHRAERTGTPLSVAMLDLDHFKRFNDTYGHDAGDLLLREASRVMSENLRASDIACRYGGEEFLLVLPGSSLEDTVQRLEQMRLQIERTVVYYEGQMLATMTFSAGIAMAPTSGASAETLVRAADEALYVAKQAGRNRIERYRAAV